MFSLLITQTSSRSNSRVAGDLRGLNQYSIWLGIPRRMYTRPCSLFLYCVKQLLLDIIAHASRVDRKTTIKNAVPGYANRDGHMTWSRDGHMTKVPDCSKSKNKNIIKNKKKYVAIQVVYLIQHIFLTSDVKNKFTNILKQQKKSVVKIGGIGVSDKKSSRVKTVANVE